ncbi:MAG: hypothetical protein IIW48_05665 [Clostridia bacterium]|nr:hypothetical protein [Clostridia bacterium]
MKINRKHIRVIRKVRSFIKEMCLIVISIIISVLFCTNSEIVFGNLGFTKSLIELSDAARLDNNYSESIKWCTMLAEKENEYSPYACLALAEIYSKELDVCDYDVAFEHYKKALDLIVNNKAHNENYDDNYDNILNSYLSFMLTQIEAHRNDEGYAIDVLRNDENDENINDFIQLLEAIKTFLPSQFKNMRFEQPINKDNVIRFFAQEKITLNYYKWEYDSTMASYNGNEAFSSDEEKLVLVGSWAESIDSNSFSTVTVYKYYRYKKVYGSEDFTPTQFLKENINTKERYFIKDYINEVNISIFRSQEESTTK